MASSTPRPPVGGSGVEGKVVCISGAAAGVGLGLSLGFKQDGAVVAGFDVRGTARETSCHDLFGAVDVTDARSVEEFVDSVVGKFGRLDCMIAAAEVAPYSSVLEGSLESVRRSVDVIQLGALHCFHASLRHMTHQGHGRLIAVTRRSAELNQPGGVGYNMSHAAVISLVRTLAHELELEGHPDIIASAMIPGATPVGVIGGQVLNNPKLQRWLMDPPGVAYRTAKHLSTAPLGSPSGLVWWDAKPFAIYERLDPNPHHREGFSFMDDTAWKRAMAEHHGRLADALSRMSGPPGPSRL